MVLAVEILVAAGGDFDGAAAVEADDRRDRPAVEDLFRYRIRTVVVIEMPDAGDAGDMALIVIHWTALLPQVVPVLRSGETDGRLVGALEGMAPDIETVEQEIVGERAGCRDLERVVGSGLVGDEIDVLAQNAGVIGAAGVDAGLRGARSGSIGRVVVVDHERDAVGQRSDIGCGHRDMLRQLALDGCIDLVDVGPAVVGADGFNAGGRAGSADSSDCRHTGTGRRSGRRRDFHRRC